MIKNMMKTKKLIVFSFLLFLLCSLIPLSHAHAKETDKEYIFDDASLLTQKEADKLNALAKKYSKDIKVDILILTTDDAKDYNTIEFCNIFYDNHIANSSVYNKDSVILCIDISKRKKSIQSYEDAQEKINASRCNKIVDKITPDLKDDDYYDALLTYINKVHDYSGYPLDVNPDNLIFKLWFQFLLAGLIGATTIGVMIYHSSGRITTNSRTYLDLQNSKLTGSYDNYIRTTVTRVRKPDPKDNNDGGGSGTTGGGSSFSSSGESDF